MSVERSVDNVDVDLEANAARATLEISIEDLFEDGELRMWEDDAGWSGYVLEDDVFYHVNTHHGEDSWLRKVRCGEGAVREAIKQRIEEPAIGGPGTFVRGASPP